MSDERPDTKVYFDDNPTAKVISFATRQPWHEEQAEKRRQRRSEGQRKRRDKTEAQKELRESTLESLDKIRALVASGQLEGLVIALRDRSTGLFLTDVVFDERLMPANDMFAWVGVLGTLEMELKESAMMAASVQLDGSVVDPFLDRDEAMFEGDGFDEE